MKKFKMLMMVALTITSVSIFAQVATSNQMKHPKQNSPKAICICPMHPNMVMDNMRMCQDFRRSLNLFLKEKMKREEMKIAVSSTNNEARIDMLCSLSKSVTTLNLSSKEKMKWEAMRNKNSHLVNTPNTCQMMNVLTNSLQINCVYCSSPLNLSPKEKMKRDAVRI